MEATPHTQPRQSWTFSNEINAEIRRAAVTGIYDIRGGGAKRRVPHFDDLLFLGASMSRYPLEGYREKCETSVTLGTRFAKKPIELKIPITIAGMSFGSLSGPAKEALGRGATMAGTSTTTGDGGMTEEERGHSEKLVYQYLPSRYGMNPDDLRRADAIEVVVGQGAKPGGGGMLLGQKITERVAGMRDLPVGIDQRSACRHPDWTGPDDLEIKILELREITGWEKPIYVKVGGARPYYDTALAVKAGADVVVLDHHLGGETLPPALAVVNPNRQDESGDLGHLCAAGVVFLMLVEAGRQMRAAGQNGPNLLDYLDLVALATVADVAPLIGVNRALVRQGLKVMAGRTRPGLVALSDVARMDSFPTPYHLGFLLGPRVNAGGRIGQADLGARLLATDDPAEAAALAERLDQLNTERREIENAVRDQALEQAQARGLDGPLVWAAGEGWHPGVVGIVASRLKEATARPAVVIGLEGDEGKGSGRSIAGVDLGASIQRLAAEGLLLKGGGHKMAAGLTVARDRLEEAMERLSGLLDKQGAGAAGPADLRLDGLLMPGAATVELIEAIESAGPFGAGAPAPRFAFPEAEIRFAKRVGVSHLKLTFGDGLAARLEAICFGAFDGPLGPMLEGHGGARFHLAGRLEINSWGGRQRVQLRLEDAARA